MVLENTPVEPYKKGKEALEACLLSNALCVLSLCMQGGGVCLYLTRMGLWGNVIRLGFLCSFSFAYAWMQVFNEFIKQFGWKKSYR